MRAIPIQAVGLILLSALPVFGQSERMQVNGDRVAIFNLAGEVRIERGTGESVVVEVRRGGDDADRLSLDRGTHDGWSTLVVRYPGDRIVYSPLGRFSRTEFDVGSNGLFGLESLRAKLGSEGFEMGGPRISLSGRDRVRISGSGSGLEAWADLRILVPEGRTIAINLGAGTVYANNVNGHVRIETHSGSIDATGIKGSLLAQTGSGKIRVTDATGHVRIDTGSGGVNVANISKGVLSIDTGSGAVDGSALDVLGLDIDTGSGGVELNDVTAPALSVNTGSGGIRVARARTRDVNLDTGSGAISLDLLTDVRTATLDTGSGGVTVTVPADLGAELVVDAGSGGITTDLSMQVTQKKRGHLRGRIGDGDGRIEIDTGSGGVRLRSR